MTERDKVVEVSKVLFEDRFRHGEAELPWRAYPAFNQDTVRGARDPSRPEGDQGIGILRNANAGGFVALSYVALEVPRNFAVDASIFATVCQEPRGQLNGLAFRIDPGAERFYRVATDFAANPVLSLAYVGRDSRNMPVHVHKWPADELPGGRSQQSGWHRLRVAVADDLAEVFWDGLKLPGGPFAVQRSPVGFAGVYANYIGNLGVAETRVRDFRVESDQLSN